MDFVSSTFLTRAKARTILVAATLGLLVLPAWAAPSQSQIVETITNAKILPASVALNARYSMGEVSLYMYRSAKVSDNDLKIDSVLITKTLRDKFGADIKSVQLNFYDKESKAQIRQCTVNQMHLNSFASRQISQDQLLAFLNVTRLNAGSTSSGSTSNPLLNANVEAVLAMTTAPGFKVDERTILLARIKSVARKNGSNYQRLAASYKNIDDLIRAGKTEEIIPYFNELSREVQLSEAAVALQTETQNNDAQLKATATQIRSQLSAPPRFGMCYRRRYALWVMLSRMQLAGRDIVYPAVLYSKRVEGPFAAGNKPELQRGIIEVEQALGIQPTSDWD